MTDPVQAALAARYNGWSPGTKGDEIVAVDTPVTEAEVAEAEPDPSP
jgi:hypothetical protein